MAVSVTDNIGLYVYDDIDGVYQKDLRESYRSNFKKIDAAIVSATDDEAKTYLGISEG